MRPIEERDIFANLSSFLVLPENRFSEIRRLTLNVSSRANGPPAYLTHMERSHKIGITFGAVFLVSIAGLFFGQLLVVRDVIYHRMVAELKVISESLDIYKQETGHLPTKEHFQNRFSPIYSIDISNGVGFKVPDRRWNPVR